MKILAILIILALGGCATIPDSALNSIANAGGGCAKGTGMWGSLIVMTGSTDKGVIRNGEVTVAGECGGITIRDAATVRAIAPIPGTVVTTTTPATSTTTVVQPAAKPSP